MICVSDDSDQVMPHGTPNARRTSQAYFSSDVDKIHERVPLQPGDHPNFIVCAVSTRENMDNYRRVYSELNKGRTLELGAVQDEPPQMADLGKYVEAGVCFYWVERMDSHTHTHDLGVVMQSLDLIFSLSIEFPGDCSWIRGYVPHKFYKAACKTHGHYSYCPDSNEHMHMYV
jgi:hypothetical protein